VRTKLDETSAPDTKAGLGHSSEKILSTVSKELIREFGQGYSTLNLSRMIRFVEVFLDWEIVLTLSIQLARAAID
jgi:hypothetical protein